MSKRFRKSLVLLCMGGASMFFFGPYLGDAGCTQNADLKAFFQTIGTTAVDRISDTAFDYGVVDSDYDRYVRGPTTDLFQDMWNNFVFTWFPEDPTNVPVVK